MSRVISFDAFESVASSPSPPVPDSLTWHDNRVAVNLQMIRCSWRSKSQRSAFGCRTFTSSFAHAHAGRTLALA